MTHYSQTRFLIGFYSRNNKYYNTLLEYLFEPHYTGPKLTPALIGVIFQMFTVKLSRQTYRNGSFNAI